MVRPDLDSLRLLGGCACLDFCNTIDERTSPQATDVLSDYRAVARWARKTRLIAEAELNALLSQARKRPVRANGTFKRSLRLREALYRILSSVAEREAASPIDLDILNSVLRRASAHAHLTQRGRRFVYVGSEKDAGLERPQWLVAQSAAELLISPELERVRKCSGRNCGWLFVDRSKNRSRHWCSMEGCGSRAKMRRLYAHRRARRGAPAHHGSGVSGPGERASHGS